MSCCGGNCGCGPACKCGSGCGGCKMYPDLSYQGESATTETLVFGIAPAGKAYLGGSEEMGFVGAENGGCGNSGCSCGASCSCGSSCKCGK